MRAFLIWLFCEPKHDCMKWEKIEFHNEYDEMTHTKCRVCGKKYMMDDSTYNEIFKNKKR